MKRLLMASAAILTLSTTVNAEGNFQGFYTGLNTGYSAFKDNTSQSASGINAGVQAGYNYQFNNFVVGAELGANYGNHKIDLTTAGRLGFAINNFLPYGKVGLINTSFDGGSESHNALLLGAGLEAIVTDHIIVGGEWTTAEYENKSGNTLRSHEFKARLSYKF